MSHLVPNTQQGL